MHHHQLFDDKSDLYADSRPEYPGAVFSFLASMCPATSLAWDSACGNGQAAVGLISEFDRVYATDISREQISNAKFLPGIAYEVMESESTPLESASCDLICVAQALHWFDFDFFWPEARRVLKPGGIFSAIGYNWPSVSGEIDAEIRKRILDVIDPYWAPQSKLIWNHYRDLEIPFEKQRTPEFTMQANWNLDELFNLIHTVSATRRCMDDKGEDFFHEAYSAVSDSWGEPELKRNIDLDFVFYAGRNEK